MFVSISVPAMDTALDGPLTGASDWAHASSERVGVVPGSWNSHKAPADHLISAPKAGFSGGGVPAVRGEDAQWIISAIGSNGFCR